jgi:branched-chain amino acid transport system ATP-binding protein
LAPDQPLLVMHGACAQYGRVRVLEQIEFSLRGGESVAILGANGAGKTTLLRAISGLMAQRSGQILFEGADISREPSHRIVRLGISQVAEGRHLFPSLSVIENLEMGGLVPSTTGRAAEVAEALELTFNLFPRLAERRMQLARTLSGGEQQMLAIGRALMARPKLMLLDEPSVGLAPKVVSDLLHAVRALKEMGLAVILAEQNIPLALDLADRAVVLHLGRIVLEGEAKDLQQSSELRKIYLGSE